MASVAGLLALGISFIFACLNVCGNIPIERARLRSLTNLSIASGGRCCSTFLYIYVCMAWRVVFHVFYYGGNLAVGNFPS